MPLTSYVAHLNRFTPFFQVHPKSRPGVSEWEEDDLNEGESSTQAEAKLEEVDIDPSFKSEWVDREIRSKTHTQKETKILA